MTKQKKFYSITIRIERFYTIPISELVQFPSPHQALAIYTSHYGFFSRFANIVFMYISYLSTICVMYMWTSLFQTNGISRGKRWKTENSSSYLYTYNRMYLFSHTTTIGSELKRCILLTLIHGKFELSYNKLELGPETNWNRTYQIKYKILEQCLD